MRTGDRRTGGLRPHSPRGGNSTDDRLLVGYALAQLRAEDRAVLSRSYYQGLTTAQIAADLDIAEGMVKSRLHDALHALRQLLDTQTGNGDHELPPTTVANPCK